MSAATPTKGDALGFPAKMRSRYRLRRERLGPGEYDVTIPLRGKRGFVYPYGSGWYGVWLNHHRPNVAIERLREDFPRLSVQQVGMGECTFRVPGADLGHVLERLDARIRGRRILSQEQKAELTERCARMRERKRQKLLQESALERQESTQQLRDVV